MMSPDAPAPERIEAATAMADTDRVDAGQAVIVDLLRTHQSAEVRMEALEHELASVRRDLSETQERLNFAERLLAQSREGKRLGAPE